MSASTLPLDPWVELLEAALPADENGLLVRLARVPGDGAGDGDDPKVEVGLLRLDGVHPVELLDGFDAPDDWFALGVVTRGWAAPIDGGRPSRHPARRSVVTTVLLDREGNAAGRVVTEDGTVVAEHPPPEGAVVDALRAALGVSRRTGAAGGEPQG